MYSRSYNDMGKEMNLPESYGGVALQGGFAAGAEGEEEKSVPASAEAKGADRSEKGFLGGMFDSLLQKSGIGRLGERLPFLKSFGSEEILIILAALFLLFSKDGDKECAAALILLLFIT